MSEDAVEMQLASHPAKHAIIAHPLLRSILRSLIDDNAFVDLDADNDVAFEMEHGDELINWCTVEGSASKLLAQLCLWSNTRENLWVMYVDLHVETVPSVAITVHLNFFPMPHRATGMQERVREEAVATEEDWAWIRANILEPWIQEGLEMERVEEEGMSDEDTDRDEPH